MIWLLREFSRSLPQPARCATWCHLAENENSCENSSQDSKFSCCRSVEKKEDWYEFNCSGCWQCHSCTASAWLCFTIHFKSDDGNMAQTPFFSMLVIIIHQNISRLIAKQSPPGWQDLAWDLLGGRARKKTWSASSCIISSFENWEQPQKTAWKTTHVVRGSCDPQDFFDCLDRIWNFVKISFGYIWTKLVLVKQQKELQKNFTTTYLIHKVRSISSIRKLWLDYVI